jgi:hypothetical protein
VAFDTFTAVLNAADFPFVSDFFQRPVIIPGTDQPPRIPRSLIGDQSQQNTELAQHYYAQNVMPTAEGLMSVGYDQLIPALVGAVDFDQVITLRDDDENNFLLSPARGKNYIYTANNAAWQSISSFAGWLGDLVTKAYVNGRTFVCYQRHSIREFDVAASTFNAVPFTGVSPLTIDCIGASNNYLVYASNITVGWSSLIDPTDLTPNINTGAGSAIPQDVKGPVRAIVPISGGFIIYTTKNAVAALYTNNARAPFAFKEVSNAGGVQLPEQISLEASDVHYAWTTNGLQEIKVSGAKDLNIAAADFLAGRILETFNLTTLQLTVQRLSQEFDVKITFISGRFLVISYGIEAAPQTFTHALVYDTGLKRWGKLRIDHCDCFPYPYPNLIGNVSEVPSKGAVAFLKKDGTIQLLIMDYRIRQDQGVLLLGRFQLVRQKLATHQSLELESSIQAYPPDVYLILSADGKTNSAPAKLQLLADSGTLKKYGGPTYSGSGPAPQRTGKNFSILCVGKFEATTSVFTVTRHGNR